MTVRINDTSKKCIILSNLCNSNFVFFKDHSLFQQICTKLSLCRHYKQLCDIEEQQLISLFTEFSQTALSNVAAVLAVKFTL